MQLQFFETLCFIVKINVTFWWVCVSSVQAAKRELERQRQLEWERQRRQELLTQRNREQESIVMLKARKKTLEFELEALVIKHTCTHTHNQTCCIHKSRREHIVLVNQGESHYCKLTTSHTAW